MKRSTLLGGLAAAAAVLPVGSNAQTRAAALNIALTANDSAAEVLYARELGYFESAGLTVTMQVLSNGSLIASGLVAGSIDVGNSNVLSIVPAFQKGLPITVIAPASIYNGRVPQLSVLVPKDSLIRGPRDFAGKVIATNPARGIGELATMAWIEKGGGDPAAAKFIELPFPEMGSALAQGRVDAATPTEPFTTMDKGETRNIGAPYGAVAPTFMTVAWIASSLWAKAHPDAIARFQAVMKRAAHWANDHHAESGAMLAKYTKINPDLVSQMARVPYGEELRASLIQPNIDLAAKYKLIDAPFPAQELVYQAPR